MQMVAKCPHIGAIAPDARTSSVLTLFIIKLMANKDE
jgi:hypothetical protein